MNKAFVTAYFLLKFVFLNVHVKFKLSERFNTV